MDEPSVLDERVKVREVTGIFASSIAASPAVDSLLIAGFDRPDTGTGYAIEVAMPFAFLERAHCRG